MKLPDFVIVGAMKSGTSTLHQLLSAHPDLYLPPVELFFFDIDDFEAHPDFAVHSSGEWQYFDFERNRQQYLEWYASFFDDAREAATIGERSTTYIASRKAPARIASIIPKAKLIFLLRDPVRRAYSHYWHLVRSGRACQSFESMIRGDSGGILRHGRYKEQIERFAENFDSSQLLFLLFEDFVRNQAEALEKVCAFLDVEAIPASAHEGSHRNRAVVPRSTRLQFLLNRLFEGTTSRIYGHSHLPWRKPPAPHPVLRLLRSAAFRAIRSRHAKYPPMATETRAFLEFYYARENQGLDELVGVETGLVWPYMRRAGASEESSTGPLN